MLPGLMSPALTLTWCGQNDENHMKAYPCFHPSFLISAVQACGGVMVWGYFLSILWAT